MTVLNDPFSRLITTLEPWLGQIVIIGGWAHQLYRRHPDARQLDYSPLTTIDTDVALPHSLLTHQPDIRARLLAGGFKEEFLGDDHPPATHYHLASELSGFYVEFLTPLIGSQYSRNHKRKTTIEISGVISQQLRYIEILLQHPSTINFPSGGVACQLNVANPGRVHRSESAHSCKAAGRIGQRTFCTCTTPLRFSARGCRNCVTFGKGR